MKFYGTRISFIGLTAGKLFDIRIIVNWQVENISRVLSLIITSYPINNKIIDSPRH